MGYTSKILLSPEKYLFYRFIRGERLEVNIYEYL